MPALAPVVQCCRKLLEMSVKSAASMAYRFSQRNQKSNVPHQMASPVVRTSSYKCCLSINSHHLPCDHQDEQCYLRPLKSKVLLINPLPVSQNLHTRTHISIQESHYSSPILHTSEFKPFSPLRVLLFPKLIYQQRTHFRQQFRSKWIMVPFICLIFIWSIFHFLICYSSGPLLAVHSEAESMLLLSQIRVSKSFQSLTIPFFPSPQHLLNNSSHNLRVFHFFVFLTKWKNISV